LSRHGRTGRKLCCTLLRRVKPPHKVITACSAPEKPEANFAAPSCGATRTHGKLCCTLIRCANLSDQAVSPGSSASGRLSCVSNNNAAALSEPQGCRPVSRSG
jgi:hypothetical protein